MQKQTIIIEEEKLNFINQLLKLTGDQIYDKYGLKRDETITYTAKFSNNIEADIKLVICDGSYKPYVEGVLFENGNEVTHTDIEESYDGQWEFEFNNETYIVNVITEKIMDKEYAYDNEEQDIEY